ncbi:MAG: family 20 glycosylhydrolase [Buchananella hordeovulneris]|nr:family 20 glycosylhydrolase [Buchananella hordeovulneris]
MRNRFKRSAMGVMAGLAALSLLSTTSAFAEEADRNIALGQPVLASGVENPSKWGPEKVVDGDDGNGGTANQVSDAASRWSGPGQASAHITVQLPPNAVAKRVRIQWAGACSTEYQFQYSTDGQTFQPASERIVKTGPECFKKSIETPLSIPAGVKPTHLRLQSFALRNQWGPSLWEFEIWGTADAPPPPPPPASDIANVVPLPANVVAGEGKFTLAADAKIGFTGGGQFAAEDLASLLRRSTGYDLPIADSGAVQFVLDPAYAGGNEGYELRVTSEGVTAKAKTEAGLFYASRTLLQLLGPWATSAEVVSGPWEVSCLTITDAPRYAYRGVMVDIVRSFLTKDELLTVVDQMAQVKMNKLHLHLTDDQAWRFEVSNEGKAQGDDIDYSLLTTVSAKTSVISAKWAPISSAPDAPVFEGHPRVPGATGYYTQDDIRAIVAYAGARNIEVIPEIDGPAHSNAQLHAIPQLNGGGSYPVLTAGQTTVPAITNTSVGEANMGARNENTYKFLAHVFGQVTDLMPGSYLHVGGDEPHNISSEDYATFMERTMPLIAARNRTPMVWNEAAVHADKLPDGTVIQYWNGNVNATRNAILSGRGMKLIMSPASNTYFPQKQSAALVGPNWACGGVLCDIEKFYNWDPSRSGPAVGDEHMLGVSAAFWAEHTRGITDTQFWAFPRLLATAEVGWTPQADRKFADFAKRMASRGVSLNLANINFYADPKVDWGNALRGDAKVEADGNLAYLHAPIADMDLVTVNVTDANGAAVAATLVGTTAAERGQALRRPGDTATRAVNSIYSVRTAQANLAGPLTVNVNVGGKALTATAVVPTVAPTPEPTVTAPAPTPTPTVTAPKALRLFGDDRVATAIAAAKNGGYTPGVALLATGKDYADAVTAGPLAGVLDAPLYFTTSGALEPAVLKALRDTQVTKVYIVGGTNSVSAAKERALRAANIEVVRVQGADRFATAQAITTEMTKLGKAPKRFFLADSTSYPDALGAGVAAGRNEGAVLLTSGKTIPAATAAVLNAASDAPVVLVGGRVVNAHADAMLKTSREVNLVSGSDRYETAVYLYSAYCADATKLVVASGENFADALAAGARALADDGALVLVRAKELPSEVSSRVKWEKIKRLELLGGERSVSTAVFNQLKAKLIP